MDNDPDPARMWQMRVSGARGAMTVSRVVNGRGGVGPERAARVWHVIEQLDYRHNVTARNLRLTGQPTVTIGVLLCKDGSDERSHLRT